MSSRPLVALVLTVLALPSAAEDRTYHRVTVAQVATTKWTHVQVEGTVDYVATEDDGDLHFRIADGGATVVCEIVPYHPLPRPHVGDRVRVSGITRYDKAHRWAEIHPVEQLDPLHQ